MGAHDSKIVQMIGLSHRAHGRHDESMMQDDEYDWVDDDSLDLAETQRKFNLLRAANSQQGQTALLVVGTGRTVAPESYNNGHAEALRMRAA